MIFWIASYPKSGNTWLRALISSYYFSKTGIFSADLLKNIGQFPEKSYFKDFDYNKNQITDTSRYWIKAQEKINRDKKIKFLKTHNIFGKINNNNFTNKQNSIGCIYIVRDPRNVITSLKHHYEMSYSNALDFMMSEKKYIFDYHSKNDFSDFQLISSWDKNYKSWKNQNIIPTLLIRYEDLLTETFSVFKNVVEFINYTIKNENEIDKNKLKNSIFSTEFNKLKDYEKKNGFSGAVLSKQNLKKIPFFHLGPKNDWKKYIDKDMQNKILKAFKQDLFNLSYLN